MSIGLNQYIIKLDKSEKSRNMITALILMLDIEKASHLANDGLHKNSNDSIDLLASINRIILLSTFVIIMLIQF